MIQVTKIMNLSIGLKVQCLTIFSPVSILLLLCKYFYTITVPKTIQIAGPLTKLSIMKILNLGKPLLKLKSVDSTNNYAVALLNQGTAGEGTVILADYQTQGKGHGDNKWSSHAGQNLLFSIILHPGFLLAERQFFLSMCISKGIVDFLVSIDQPAQIKWPNDILINGKKVAGILIENTILGKNLHTSVIGIGLNINQQDFPSDLPNSTSLCLVANRKFNLDDCLSKLMLFLNSSLNILYSERYAIAKTDYLNHLWRLNEWAMYKDISGPFEGRIVEVSDPGELMILHRGGEIKNYGFKEIEYAI
jgi:BirA family biotin operon repressor/biotin-[acetyl-CoA-carboxylase] ligase